MSMINCEICGAACHSISLHLQKDHPGTTLESYQARFPEAPLLSDVAKQKLEEQRLAKAAKAPAPAATATSHAPTPAASSDSSGAPAVSTMTKVLHEVFGIDPAKNRDILSKKGGPVPVTIIDHSHKDLVPEVDNAYVYDAENLKNAVMALELNIPMYVWGHAGTGKTTLIEQICARTGRPVLRVQHTANTEEVHVVGQYVARGGETHFEYGPLAMAMLNGWVYLADEYDFALPSILAVYQPVLEGKALVIKEAPAAQRIVKPHPNFRFVATGNTNGSGDETGLYQGTVTQNAANYDRFHMVLHMKYMQAEQEKKILVGQAGIAPGDAERLVDFANRVRESYDGNKISAPISPRTLVAAAKIGARRGSFRTGLSLAFMGKLSRVDFEVVDGLAQRIFGS